jgi:hypothetical protein
MKRETVRCREATATSFFGQNSGAKSSHIFKQSPLSVTAEYIIDCFTCQEEFIMNNPIDVKVDDEHALDFALYLFSICPEPSMPYKHRARLMLSSPNACLLNTRVSFAVFSRFAQHLMLFIFQAHRQIALGQIHDFKCKDVKYQHVHPDMLVMSPTVPSRCCNCCTAGSNSSENYGWQWYTTRFQHDRAC